MPGKIVKKENTTTLIAKTESKIREYKMVLRSLSAFLSLCTGKDVASSPSCSVSLNPSFITDAAGSMSGFAFVAVVIIRSDKGGEYLMTAIANIAPRKVRPANHVCGIKYAKNMEFPAEL
jgi:hypothetical protein